MFGQISDMTEHFPAQLTWNVVVFMCSAMNLQIPSTCEVLATGTASKWMF